jgi:hypothetical protein
MSNSRDESFPWPKQTVQTVLPVHLIEDLKALASTENRSLSNMIYILISEALVTRSMEG